MNSNVSRFYRKFVDEDAPIRLYHDVLALHESEVSWEEISKKVPDLPRGWYELTRLNSQDRIEFVRDFWLKTLPYVPHVHTFLQSFFGTLDDVGVYLTQLRYDSPYECEMVYSLRNGTCFFIGFPPSSTADLSRVQKKFAEVLPVDYLAFLHIHDGFSKHTDTGILKLSCLEEFYDQFQRDEVKDSREIVSKGQTVDPKDLIPFYESFGQSSYQCFFVGWIPEKQVGNVYYSPVEKKISVYDDSDAWLENLAFPNFSDWLTFYLEGIEF